MFFIIDVDYTKEEVSESTGYFINKKVHLHLLCESLNYTEAETLVTKYAMENIEGDFVIKCIRPFKISQQYQIEGCNEEDPWYKCVFKYEELNEKGKVKKYSKIILIQHPDSDSIMRSIKDFIKRKYGLNESDFEIINLSKTKISKFID